MISNKSSSTALVCRHKLFVQPFWSSTSDVPSVPAVDACYKLQYIQARPSRRCQHGRSHDCQGIYLYVRLALDPVQVLMESIQQEG